MAMDFKKNASRFAEELQKKMTNSSDDSVSTGVRNMLSVDGLETQIQYIPIDQIDTFKNHPFHVRDDAEMEQLVESIKRDAGVLTPVTVRKKDDGRYEMISGHRRKHACELAGLTEIPAIVVQLSDAEAVIRMVDANLQREKILPSEKAFAYKMKMDALRRQGQRSDLTSHQVGEKLSTASKIGSNAGDSQSQVLRYIRLTYLISPLLDMVDEKRLPFMTGVTLSYLSEIEQTALLEVMENESVTPSLQQAEELKKRSKEIGLHGRSIQEILFPERFTIPDKRHAEREADAARREQLEAELEAREARVTEQVRMDLAQLQRDDPNEEPLVIATGKQPGDVSTDNALRVFFQAAEETHGALMDQGNAERTAKAVCKRLDSLQDWFEANTDKDTLDRFLDTVTDLEELLNAQGLLK